MDIKEFRVIRHYISPYLGKLAVITVLAVICAFFEAISLGALVPLLQLMEQQEDPGGTLWGILKLMFRSAGLELNLLTLLAFLTFLFLLGQVLFLWKKILQVRFRVGFIADMKKQLFSQVLQADISYHNAQKAGNQMNVLILEVENAGYGIFAALELLTDIFFIAVYALMLLYISVEMTLICLGISVASFYLMNTILRKSTASGKKLVEWNTAQNEFLSERFNLLRLIKTYSTESRESEQFGRIAEGYRNAHASYGFAGVEIESLFQSVIFVIAVVILAVSLEVFRVPLAMLLVFLFILVRITGPLRDLNNRRHELAREIPSFLKVDGVLTEATASQRITGGSRPFPGFQQDIVFDHITYSYDRGNPPVLSDVFLVIRKHEMVALVGGSGGGKSTLVDLLIRLLDPDGGAIRIDGVDIREYDLRSYRARLGVVSQDIYLLSGTVLENICYGSDRVSRETAEEAARMAHADDYIRELPAGYDSLLGEKGVNLSGGQRQRIALARALYRNPEILILDEATSSLDPESERIIQASIMDLRKKYTIIVIAHRLSTIEHADRIIVMEKGIIVEEGSHRELLDHEGTYARFYRT